MNNNDVLRRIRYIFDFADTKIVQIFSLVDVKIESKDVTRWLKKEDDPWILDCTDKQLAMFLNGLIVSRRGKKEGPLPVPEKVLNNNIILRKLKIALDYKSDDMLETLALAGITISEHELSALFRKESHKHYRECQNQLLRNFLEGLRIKFRPSK